MNYRKLRREIIDLHWDNDDPKVERVCKKLSKKIYKDQKQRIDTLGNMYLKLYE